MISGLTSHTSGPHLSLRRQRMSLRPAKRNGCSGDNVTSRLPHHHHLPHCFISLPLPHLWPFPLLSPATICSSLSTPTGDSREQQTSLKAMQPSSEPPPHLAPCLSSQQADSQKRSSSTSLSPHTHSPPKSLPHSVHPMFHVDLVMGRVWPPDSSNIIDLLDVSQPFK